MISSTTKTARAYQYDACGTLEQQLVLRSDVALPPLSPGQVRIRVQYAAINPVDYMLVEDAGASEHLTGRVPSRAQPSGFGFDAAGVVDEVGANVSKFRVGDEVFAMAAWSGMGTLADFIAVDEQLVAKKPANLSFELAAGVPLVALTAYQALFDHTKLQKGEKLLILGGSTSCGQIAIQLARAIGAEVIVTASSRNFELVKSLGATQVIDYTAEKWVDVVEQFSVDVLLNCGVESDSWNTGGQHVLKSNTGRFVSLLPLDQPVLPAKSGAKLVYPTAVQPSGEQLEEIAQFIERGQVTVRNDSVFEFEELFDAINKLKTRRACGKIVVRVA